MADCQQLHSIVSYCHHMYSVSLSVACVYCDKEAKQSDRLSDKFDNKIPGNPLY